MDQVCEKRGWYGRGYLPHRDDYGLIQFVTFRLYDSVPLQVLKDWTEELKHLPRDQREREEATRVSRYIDRGEGQCFLRNPRVAEIVQDALLHFHGKRYEVHEWTIMPNHVHVLTTLGADESLDKVVHSWKSYTAKECNKILGRTGEFWFRDYYDRFIRNEDHYNRVVDYIANNPVKAKLCRAPGEWVWSSSHTRP